MSAWQLLPAIRELYSRRPEYFSHEPWEQQHVLYSLGYVGVLAADAEQSELISRLDTLAT